MKNSGPLILGSKSCLMNDHQIKNILRRQILAARKVLAEDVWKDRNKLLQPTVVDFVVRSSANVIHSFLPIERNKEVDTWPIVKEMIRLEKKVVVSVTNLEQEKMYHYYYHSGLKFKLNKLRIPEPMNAEAANVSTIDLILIPLLAADKSGNRIGYGKGYYDRLLSELPKVKKVGLALGPLFDAFNFAESHDIRLDHCITPFETYSYL